ncbi:adenine nucleotide alpha hydrolase [Aliikangiella coralliicola]|uniref:Adenine nucleotide alpha hydrolase n=1 Tax=Aliikangiella coralliicola TaxID=2592383 RepID=A0A545UH75_9GAMM|nr:adenine nucleotide alpha hydrolase [Aliikangiella coralliicola]TQV88827.1 adenine nucleotide alpha hydrolase [Aliikangiella coralliicola]
MQNQKSEKVIVSWSSGKDSTLTLLRLLEKPDYEVVGLFTTYYQDYIPFQATPLEMLRAQAERIGIPLITQELPKVFPDNKVYQSLVVNALQSCGIEFDAVAFGDMFCNGIVDYRRSYIEPAGWKCVFPLLGENTDALAQEIIDRKIKTFVCTVDTTQLDGGFVGRQFDRLLLEGLPDGVDPCGEDGEFHTFVHDAPCFSEPIHLEMEEINRESRFHYQKYKILKLNQL